MKARNQQDERPFGFPATAMEEVSARITTLRKQAESARAEAAEMASRAEAANADAERRDRLADEYQQILA